MSVWWSWGLAAVGLAGIYLAGRKLAAGWLVGVIAQIPWGVYAVVTRQWGFVVTAIVYAGFYGRNWLRWRRDENQRRHPRLNPTTRVRWPADPSGD